MSLHAAFPASVSRLDQWPEVAHPRSEAHDQKYVKTIGVNTALGFPDPETLFASVDSGRALSLRDFCRRRQITALLRWLLYARKATRQER